MGSTKIPCVHTEWGLQSWNQTYHWSRLWERGQFSLQSMFCFEPLQSAGGDLSVIWEIDGTCLLTESNRGPTYLPTHTHTHTCHSGWIQLMNSIQLCDWEKLQLWVEELHRHVSRHRFAHIVEKPSHRDLGVIKLEIQNLEKFTLTKFQQNLISFSIPTSLKPDRKGVFKSTFKKVSPVQNIIYELWVPDTKKKVEAKRETVWFSQNVLLLGGQDGLFQWDSRYNTRLI